MICLHGGGSDPGDLSYAEFRRSDRTQMGTSLRRSESVKPVMTVGEGTVLPLSNVHDALIEVICLCLAWVMAFRTTTSYKIIASSPYRSIKVRMRFMRDEKQKQFIANHFVKGCNIELGAVRRGT